VLGDFGAFLLITAIAVAAPMLADRAARWVPVPLVVFEILLGVLLGPQALGLGRHGQLIETLSELGLATLMFLAGYEIDFARVSGAPLRRAAFGWLLCLVLAVCAGMLIGSTVTEGVFIGAAMATTALGTILPIVRDAGELDTPFGATVLAVGAVGEFGPIIAISLFLSGRSPGVSAVVLLIFAGVTALAVRRALRSGRDSRLHGLVARTLRTSGQFAVRLLIFVLVLMVTLAVKLGLDMLLGAFTAGVLGRLLLSGVDEEMQEAVMSKLEAVGFGFFVPIFFVNTGLDFDLDALTGDAGSLLMLPLFFALFLALRGAPTALLAERGTARRDRIGLGLFAATQLPLVVSITTIGVQNKQLDSSLAAALVGVAMLSVLCFPLLALRLRGEPAAAFPARTAAEAW
jgi:Kef-type K+ transport system membrane component KefB